MPTFGNSSLAQLGTCHPDLQRLFGEVVKTYDCKIVEGFRGEAAQNYAFDHGFSQKRWPNGNHNRQPSTAADVYPYPIDPKMDGLPYTKRMLHFAGFVQGVAKEMGIPIRWGGDWDSDFNFAEERFSDLPHFELLGV
jgi:peptidoglycan L-alanyl-D-glutamate endopeptidase CwlK